MIKTMNSDQQLNEWFLSSQKKLFRLTDKQWHHVVKTDGFQSLKEQLTTSKISVSFFDFIPGYANLSEKLEKKWLFLRKSSHQT